MKFKKIIATMMITAALCTQSVSVFASDTTNGINLNYDSYEQVSETESISAPAAEIRYLDITVSKKQDAAMGTETTNETDEDVDSAENSTLAKTGDFNFFEKILTAVSDFLHAR